MPPAKRTPARRATVTKARRTPARKHPARRVKIPRTGPLHAQIGARMVLFAVSHLDQHGDTVRSRKDAAILRATHEGCPTCHGNGQIFTKDKKTGAFSGSKPCPAKPTKQKVSRWAVYKASRFGADKNTGLVGWACPCGKKEKPRYRDAKEATKALRTHERKKHGGKSVGGAWYAQAAEGAAKPAKPPVQSKVVTDSGLTDEQWIKKNKKMHPGKAIANGLCWMCAGNGSLHAAFGNQQILTVCPECQGNGKAPQAA
ncbi:hypothetical protein PV733_31535 [Streptomyces europaeiscabiei]|uniref:hypothetical protein n=1 Tax=Streptomyces europaeiscabiei TaxID=146819 RepID=UPI0029BDA799|nr:hypothetical protein [Streptomyces europaeiscabiei]MDX3713396.1 hypothetical protein [Streptomyces europaeiscabiei]